MARSSSSPNNRRNRAIPAHPPENGVLKGAPFFCVHLRNLVALVLAVAYFTAVWLGESLKLSVLLTKTTTKAKRFFGAPDFHYYAIADGLSALLRSLGRYESRSGPAEFPNDPRQAELGLSF